MAYEDLPTPIALHLINFQYRRETQPVWQDEKTGTWHIYRYSDATRVLTDARNIGAAARSGSYGSAFGGISQPPPTIAQRPTVVRNLDLVRSFLSEALTPRAVMQMQPYIELTAGELLDSLLPAGKLEVMSDLAWPLATSVLGELLGIPTEDMEQADLSLAYFARLVASATKYQVPSTKYQVLGTGHRALGTGHWDPGPGANLISRLLSIEVEGERLTYDEVTTSCYYFMAAARATLSDTLGNTLLLLSMQPDVLKRLRQQPPPLYSTVEEALRYLPAVWAVRRSVIAPVALCGRNLPQGADVCVWLVSANHDREQFDHAECFDIDRIPNRHLTFGDGGTFSCMGAGLTRLVARLTLAALVKRVSSLELAPGEAVEFASHPELCGPDTPLAVANGADLAEPRSTRNLSPARCSPTKLAVTFEARV